MGPTEVTATSRYRGFKLACTQNPNGTIVWSVWTKRAEAKWDDWDLLTTGVEHRFVPLKDRDDVVEFLAAVLEKLRSRV